MPRRMSARSRALLIISTVVVGLVLLLASTVEAGGGGTETVSYRVRGGDTLWEIAKAHGDDGADPRPGVETIRRLNDLETSVIHPGQVILVPKQ